MEFIYKNWNNEVKKWDSEMPYVRYFVITDICVARHDAQGKVLAQFSARYFAIALSADEARAEFVKVVAQYPDSNWHEANPRIVKAPCAWDAHQVNVLVESLTVADGVVA